MLASDIENVASQRDLKHPCSDSYLDVHQVAQRFRETGISPRTKLVSWDSIRIDWTVLQKWLEIVGYSDIHLLMRAV
jgi:hypothetical protein